MRIGPHARGDGQKVGAGGHQWTSVVNGDAADGDTRHDHRLLPDRQHLGVGAGRGGFGQGRKEGAESDVVRAGLGGLHGEVAAIVAGDAYDAVAADQATRLAVTGVALADMNAVAIETRGEVGTVVEDQGDLAFAGDRQQGAHGPLYDLVGDLFQPYLQRRHVAALQGRLERRGEDSRILDGRWADQIETTDGRHRGFMPGLAPCANHPADQWGSSAFKP